MVQKSRDGCLLIGWRNDRRELLEIDPIQTIPDGDNTSGGIVHLLLLGCRAEKAREVEGIASFERTSHDIGRADQSIGWHTAQRTLPHMHHVVGDVSTLRPLVFQERHRQAL